MLISDVCYMWTARYLIFIALVVLFGYGAKGKRLFHELRLHR